MLDFDDLSIGNGICCFKLKYVMVVWELIIDILFFGLLDFGYFNEICVFLFFLILIIYDFNYECCNCK